MRRKAVKSQHTGRRLAAHVGRTRWTTSKPACAATLLGVIQTIPLGNDNLAAYVLVPGSGQVYPNSAYEALEPGAGTEGDDDAAPIDDNLFDPVVTWTCSACCGRHREHRREPGYCELGRPAVAAAVRP